MIINLIIVVKMIIIVMEMMISVILVTMVIKVWKCKLRGKLLWSRIIVPADIFQTSIQILPTCDEEKTLNELQLLLLLKLLLLLLWWQFGLINPQHAWTATASDYYQDLTSNSSHFHPFKNFLNLLNHATLSHPDKNRFNRGSSSNQKTHISFD